MNISSHDEDSREMLTVLEREESALEFIIFLEAISWIREANCTKHTTAQER